MSQPSFERINLSVLWKICFCDSLSFPIARPARLPPVYCIFQRFGSSVGRRHFAVLLWVESVEEFTRLAGEVRFKIIGKT